MLMDIIRATRASASHLATAQRLARAALEYERASGRARDPREARVLIAAAGEYRRRQQLALSRHVAARGRTGGV